MNSVLELANKIKERLSSKVNSDTVKVIKQTTESELDELDYIEGELYLVEANDTSILENWLMSEVTIEDESMTILVDTTLMDPSNRTMAITIMLADDQYTTIDWGDGTVETHELEDDSGWLLDGSRPGDFKYKTITHEYGTAGEYEIEISGWFGRPWDVDQTPPEFAPFKNVLRWGNTKITSLDDFFRQKVSMNNDGILMATDAPKFEPNSSIRGMARSSTSFKGGDFNHWDVSNVILANHAFFNNGMTVLVENWNVSNFLSVSYFLSTTLNTLDLSNYNLTGAVRFNDFHPAFMGGMTIDPLSPDAGLLTGEPIFTGEQMSSIVEDQPTSYAGWALI